MTELSKTVVLNNGVEMPRVGFGTAYLPNDKIPEIIRHAFDAGFRKFDTAARYGNEKYIGEAIRRLDCPREQLFIQSKLYVPNFYYGRYIMGKYGFLNLRNFRSVEKEVEASLERLGVEYIDMFLIHWPYRNFPDFYRKLAQLIDKGKIRSVGVCSCLIPHLEWLAEECEIIPAINQFEISPLNTQKELIKYCQDKGIVPEAMSTFSHHRSNAPRLEILENSKLQEIARCHNKSVAQVVNRWLIQQGITIVPKSKTPEHIRENFQLFDFSLNDEEMAIIDSLDQGKFINYDPTGMKYGMPKKFRAMF